MPPTLEQLEEVGVKADLHFMPQTGLAYVADSKCGSNTGNGLKAVFQWIVQFRSMYSVRCPLKPSEKENNNAV